MKVELRHLKMLVAIAEAGSLSSASHRLGVAQPALSTQLSRLERSFGVQLFTRSSHGAVPTSAGETAVWHAKPILAAFSDLELAVAAHRHADAVVRIGGNASNVFGDFLSIALEQFPREVRGETDTSTTVLTEDLMTYRIDAMMGGVFPGIDDECPRGMAQRTWVQEVPFLVAMAADHSLAARDDVSLQELADERWIMPHGQPDGTIVAVMRAFGEAGYVPKAPLGRVELHNSGHLLARGDGVAFTTPSFPPPPGVATVPVRDKPVVGRLVLRWNPDRVTTSEVDWMLRQLVSCYLRNVLRNCSAMPWWKAAPQYRPVLVERLMPDANPNWDAPHLQHHRLRSEARTRTQAEACAERHPEIDQPAER